VVSIQLAKRLFHASSVTGSASCRKMATFAYHPNTGKIRGRDEAASLKIELF
jgi:hypothetical protein